MDKEITIEGQKIPEMLAKLVWAGKWKTPVLKELWLSLIDKEHITGPFLYPLEKLDGKYLWSDHGGDLLIGVVDDVIFPGTIDPNRAIIVGDLGPERELVLDMRTSTTDPSVCAYIPRYDEESCWMKIASLSEFIKVLRLDL